MLDVPVDNVVFVVDIFAVDTELTQTCSNPWLVEYVLQLWLEKKGLIEASFSSSLLVSIPIKDDTVAENWAKN